MFDAKVEFYNYIGYNINNIQSNFSGDVDEFWDNCIQEFDLYEYVNFIHKIIDMNSNFLLDAIIPYFSSENKNENIQSVIQQFIKNNELLITLRNSDFETLK